MEKITKEDLKAVLTVAYSNNENWFSDKPTQDIFQDPEMQEFISEFVAHLCRLCIITKSLETGILSAMSTGFLWALKCAQYKEELKELEKI